MKKSFISAAIALAVLSTGAQASTSINGFASIKAGLTGGSEESLYGYSNKVDFKNESLFALQVKSQLGDGLSATAQLVSRGKNDFATEFEWAFISYEISDNMSIHAGRLRTPFFKYSDFKDVGYAYDWSRTPQSVYGLGFDNIEGINFYRTAQIGQADSTLQIIAGSFSGETTIAGNKVAASIEDIIGATWEVQYNNVSARAAYLQGSSTIGTETVPLAPGFSVGDLYGALNGNGLGQLTSALDFADSKSTFIGFGVTYDNQDWAIVSEFTRVEVEETFLPVQKNLYVSIAKRFDEFTPFVSYEKSEAEALSGIYAPYQAALPPQLLMPVVGLVESMNTERETFNVGVKYGFHRSAALKAQVTSQKDKLTNARSELLTVGVDVVF